MKDLGLPKAIFVAVATGQNIANFPPILQFAKKHDYVIWIVSEEAELSQWLAGSKKIFKDREILSEQVKVLDLYDPPQIAQSLLDASLFKKAINENLCVVFVLNGGPKLTPMGLSLASNELRKQGVKVFYLHGDTKCQFRKYRDLNSTPELGVYEPCKMLTLEEIVQLNGSLIERYEKIWNYGDPVEDCDYVGFEKRLLEKIDRNLNDREKNDNNANKNDHSFGHDFEDLVFGRVVKLVASIPDYESVVRNVVHGAKLKTKTKQVETDFDVAIVLLNGVVLNLECKTGTFRNKDLQSRILVLERASSTVSKFYTVIPYFPSEGRLFNRQKELWSQLEQSKNIKGIAFTPFNGYTNIFEAKNDYPMLFEEQLKKILDRYLPRKKKTYDSSA